MYPYYVLWCYLFYKTPITERIAQFSITTEKNSSRVSVNGKSFLSYVMKHNFHAKSDIFYSDLKTKNFEILVSVSSVFPWNTSTSHPAQSEKGASRVCGFIFKVIHNHMNHYHSPQSSLKQRICLI